MVHIKVICYCANLSGHSWESRPWPSFDSHDSQHLGPSRRRHPASRLVCCLRCLFTAPWCAGPWRPTRRNKMMHLPVDGERPFPMLVLRLARSVCLAFSCLHDRAHLASKPQAPPISSSCCNVIALQIGKAVKALPDTSQLFQRRGLRVGVAGSRQP